MNASGGVPGYAMNQEWHVWNNYERWLCHKYDVNYMIMLHYWKLGICHQPALCHLPADGKERLCHLLIKNRWQRTDRRQRTWLPSANSLPSASGWQIIFAMCQQMAKRLANPVAVKRLTAYQPHLFAICQQTAKILADGKEMGLFFSR